MARLRVAEPALGSSSGPLVGASSASRQICCKPARASGMDGGVLVVTIAAAVVTGAHARGATKHRPHATGAIRGQIVDAQSGLPVQGASVEVRSGNTVYGRSDAH